MTLDELRALVLASGPEDWLRLQGLPGQLFLYSAAYEGQQSGHYERAVYRPDLAIGIAWGLPAEPDADEYAADWLEVFPDKRASAYYIDLLYNGSLVDRRLAISVDGGRATLPPPSAIIEEDKIVGWETTEEEYEFFRNFALLFDVGLGRDFDSYFQQSGIQVR